MRVAALAGAALLGAAPAAAQTFTLPQTKIILRATEAPLYESNPTSAPFSAKPQFSFQTIVAADVEAALAPALTLSGFASLKAWRYPNRRAFDSNDMNAGAVLAWSPPPFTAGLRYSHFGSYDPLFRDKIELRDDVSLFVNRRFEDPWTGGQWAPGVTLARRFSALSSADRWRVSMSLPYTRKFDAWTFAARLGVNFDRYDGCGRRQCRRDRAIFFYPGLLYAFSPNAEAAFDLEFERYASNVDGKGYSSFTASPRATLRLAF